MSVQADLSQDPAKENEDAEGERNGLEHRCDLKTCGSCGVPKLLDDFHRHKSHALGRDTRCKACKRVSREKRYRLDPGGAVKASRAWKDGNAVRAKVHRQRAYARKVTAAAEDTVGDPGDLTADQWEEVLETYRVGDKIIDERIRRWRRYRCAYCGGRRRRQDLQIDHVVALSRGGRNTKSNVVPACASCTASKRDRDRWPTLESPHLADAAAIEPREVPAETLRFP